MGGLALQLPKHLPEAEKFLPEGYSYNGEYFISFDGLQVLLEREAVPDEFLNISEREIQSKSKANGLGKALVCVQALWFVAQCLTRRT